LLKMPGDIGIGQGIERDRDRGFLERLADGGDRGGAMFAQPQIVGQRAIGIVDPAAWKDHRAAGESHALGSLDHQYFGRAARPVADENQG